MITLLVDEITAYDYGDDNGDQFWAHIAAAVDSKLLKDAGNSDEARNIPAYEALMSALSKFAANPIHDQWCGFSKEDPSIVAILERVYPENELETDAEDDIENVNFTAVVFGNVA